jgi:hypothetical protein
MSKVDEQLASIASQKKALDERAAKLKAEQRRKRERAKRELGHALGVALVKHAMGSKNGLRKLVRQLVGTLSATHQNTAADVFTWWSDKDPE